MSFVSERRNLNFPSLAVSGCKKAKLQRVLCKFGGKLKVSATPKRMKSLRYLLKHLNNQICSEFRLQSAKLTRQIETN